MTHYHSQYHQDEFLDKVIFKRKQNGVFVDIGANDGVTISNTYFFEQERRWKGICFEPLDTAFRKLAKNRSSVNINGCAADRNYTDVFLSIEGRSEMLSGLKSQYDPRHLDRIARETAVHGGQVREVEVNCYDVNELIQKHGFLEIDFISIDIEGGELGILKNFNYDLLKIKVIVVENNYNDPEFNRFLGTKGFQRIKYLGGDEVYLNPAHYGLMAAFFAKLRIKMGSFSSKLRSRFGN